MSPPRTDRRPPEPVQQVKQRRDAALARMAGRIPYAAFLGASFERRGDELTARLAYDEALIGNPMLPALHGGAIGAFLEIAAIMELAWAQVWERMESGGGRGDRGRRLPAPAQDHRLHRRLPAQRPAARRLRPRPGRVNRMGRRYASVHVEAWQDNRARLFAQATGHFLMPNGDVP